MKKELSFTLIISEGRNYPYYKVRVRGSRTPAVAGELEVPVRLSFDTALLEQRTAVVVLEVPTPLAPTLSLETP